MNGIDTAIASLITSRVDSLLNITPGGVSTAQTGAANVETALTPGSTPATAVPAPQASVQTALSAVALTLTAIMRSGGEATPAVLGQTPIWAAAPALEMDAGGLPLFDTPGAANASSAFASSSLNTNATGATAQVAAAGVPVAQLAAALQQTVGESGLFYEAHLAQWLTGQRSPDTLAGEPQNRLVAASTQLPLDWAADGSEASSSGGAARSGAGSPPNGANPGASESGAAARNIPSIPNAQAARFVAGEVLASSLSDLNNQPTHGGLHAATTTAADTGGVTSQSAQAMAAVHPATAPLVRQQLDLLATGQFRWIGEAWPGARLDWTIEQEGDEWDRSGGGAASEDDQPWRTRLTLSLPTLGTVDAELTLTGTRLVARVQASPGGAARLATQGESFRQRLAAAGIDLNGLTIREIGGGAPSTGAGGAGGASAAQAASAYARSASVAAADAASGSGSAASAHAGGHADWTAPTDDYDWDM
jgi:hypothetical protein